MNCNGPQKSFFGPKNVSMSRDRLCISLILKVVMKKLVNDGSMAKDGASTLYCFGSRTTFAYIWAPMFIFIIITYILFWVLTGEADLLIRFTYFSFTLCLYSSMRGLDSSLPLFSNCTI